MCMLIFHSDSLPNCRNRVREALFNHLREKKHSAHSAEFVEPRSTPPGCGRQHTAGSPGGPSVGAQTKIPGQLVKISGGCPLSSLPFLISVPLSACPLLSREELRRNHCQLPPSHCHPFLPALLPCLAPLSSLCQEGRNPNHHTSGGGSM